MNRYTEQGLFLGELYKAISENFGFDNLIISFYIEITNNLDINSYKSAIIMLQEYLKGNLDDNIVNDWNIKHPKSKINPK